MNNKIIIKVKTENERNDENRYNIRLHFTNKQRKINLKNQSSFECADYIFFSSPLKRVYWHH